MSKEMFGERPELGEQQVAAFHKEQAGRSFNARAASEAVLAQVEAPKHLSEYVKSATLTLERQRTRMGPEQSRTHYIDYLVHFDGLLRDAVEPVAPLDYDKLSDVTARWYGVDCSLTTMAQQVGGAYRDTEMIPFESWFHEVAISRMQQIGDKEVHRQLLGLVQQQGIYRNSLQWGAYARSLSLIHLEEDLADKFPEIPRAELGAVIDNVNFATLNSLYEFTSRNGLREHNVRTTEKLAARAFPYPANYLEEAHSTLTIPTPRNQV